MLTNVVEIIFAIELQPGEEEGMTEEVLQKVRMGQFIVFYVHVHGVNNFIKQGNVVRGPARN